MMRVMIVRHAEKPSDDGHVRGVSVAGAHDDHELVVRGWQRAGALVRFFASPDGPPIARPRSIFASAATRRSPSLRSQHTVDPLAAALGMYVDKDHAEGDERDLAAAVRAAASPALIAWHHKRIPALVRAIAGDVPGCPDRWPDERFDMVWVLDRPAAEGRWTFEQVPQCLLAGDRPDPI